LNLFNFLEQFCRQLLCRISTSNTITESQYGVNEWNRALSVAGSRFKSSRLSYRHSKKGNIAAMQHRQIATQPLSTTILAKTVMRLFYWLAGMRALSKVQMAAKLLGQDRVRCGENIAHALRRRIAIRSA
jgi:hypothetical protein